jgi:hypothetical protein
MAALGPAASVATAFDGQVRPYVSAYGNLGGYGGGEFDIRIVSPLAGPWVTSVNTTVPNTQFATFCVQTNQYFTPGALYDVEISTKTNHKESKDLSPPAAYLFHQWNSGNLTGYEYSDAKDAGGTYLRARDAKDLEYAIWYLQQQNRPYTSFPIVWSDLSSQAKGWVNQASGKWADIGPVRVLRLYAHSGGGDAQDMLVEFVPEPSSLLLLAFGGSALPLIRRRRRRN